MNATDERAAWELTTWNTETTSTSTDEAEEWQKFETERMLGLLELAYQH